MDIFKTMEDNHYSGKLNSFYCPYPSDMPCMHIVPYYGEISSSFNFSIEGDSMEKAFKIAQALIDKKKISSLTVEEFIDLVNTINDIVKNS